MSINIIEYEGGCRGDFLTNFLNFNQIIIEDENSAKSFNYNSKFKKLSKNNLKPSNFADIEDFKSIIKNCKLNYLSSHTMFYFKKEHYDFIMKENIKIYKINFSKKWYKNVFIESIFKNLDCLLKNKLKIENLDAVNDNVKKNCFEKLIQIIPNTLITTYDMHNSFLNDKKTILDYEKLYMDVDIESYFNDVNSVMYKKLLKKAELKKEIELFGKKYYPADYGYIWSENL